CSRWRSATSRSSMDRAVSGPPWPAAPYPRWRDCWRPCRPSSGYRCWSPGDGSASCSRGASRPAWPSCVNLARHSEPRRQAQLPRRMEAQAGKALAIELATQFVGELLAGTPAESAHRLPGEVEHRYAHGNADDDLAIAWHGAGLVAHASGKTIALDVEPHEHAVEAQGLVVGILDAQLDQHPRLHALPCDRLDAGDDHFDGLASGEAAATGERRRAAQEPCGRSPGESHGSTPCSASLFGTVLTCSRKAVAPPSAQRR